MCQGWECHIAYIVVYIDRVNTVVVQKTSQHFLSKKFSKGKKKKALDCMTSEYYKETQF